MSGWDGIFYIVFVVTADVGNSSNAVERHSDAVEFKINFPPRKNLPSVI